MRRLTAAVVSTVILVGVAATAVVLRNRGGEDLLRIEQSRALAHTAGSLSAARVEVVVEHAPEPVPTAKRTPPRRVGCRPGGAPPLRNPWTCEIRYRSGTIAHYRVEVQPNGYYHGTGTGIIDGCCVKTPTLD